jgi:hypothetical protein
LLEAIGTGTRNDHRTITKRTHNLTAAIENDTLQIIGNRLRVAMDVDILAIE